MSLVPSKIKKLEGNVQFQVNSRADNPVIFKVRWKKKTHAQVGIIDCGMFQVIRMKVVGGNNHTSNEVAENSRGDNS